MNAGKVLFKIVRRDERSPAADDLELLDAQTRLYLGEDVKIDREFVDSLPCELSGNHRFCISKLSHPFFSTSE